MKGYPYIYDWTRDPRPGELLRVVGFYFRDLTEANGRTVRVVRYQEGAIVAEPVGYWPDELVRAMNFRGGWYAYRFAPALGGPFGVKR